MVAVEISLSGGSFCIHDMVAPGLNPAYSELLPDEELSGIASPPLLSSTSKPCGFANVVYAY